MIDSFIWFFDFKKVKRINNYLNKVMKLNSVSANSEVSDILGLTRRFASTLRPRRQVQDEATSTS